MAVIDHDLTRRRVLGTFAAAASGILGCAAAPASASAATRAPAAKGSSAAPSAADGVVPLPFRPDSLRGLSERMIVSHHDKNYAGTVRNLAAVERQLAEAGKDTPGFVVAALRERELTFRNSKTLHEAYFANLGGDGKAARATETALAKAFGSAAAWETQFRATAAGLGGGSGWVVLSFELDTAQLRIIGSGHHTQAQALAIPILVLDMYEHAYQMDYGAEAARYVDAFFDNVNWDVVEQRRERAQRLASA